MSTWSTESFVRRQHELRAGGLRALYPSQAWSMYRVAPLCESVIDFGFGSEESLLALREMNPFIRYTGIDSDTEIVSTAAAKHRDERTDFAAVDFELFDYGVAELTQGWSFVYAHDRPFHAIKKLWSCATRFSLFDVRATHLDDDVIDIERSYGEHDGQRVCYPLLSWERLLAYLAELDPRPRIEFTTYYFPPSQYVHIERALPEPFVASIVLDREGSGIVGTLVPPRRVP